MKLYLLIGCAVGFVLLLIGTFYAGNRYGANRIIAENQKSVEQKREKENEDIKELENAKSERQIVYRDRIKIVQSAPDLTGCLDAPLPDDIVRRVRESCCP